MTIFCTSFYIVQKMREGMHPQEAAEDCMRSMAATRPNIRDDQHCVIAINPRGEIGAASMDAKYPLQYAVWRDGTATVQTVKAVFS